MLEGFSKKGVHLNDPACGRRQVSVEEFDQSFTGVVLLLQPSDEFVPSGKKSDFFSSLRMRLKGSETGVLMVFLLGLALVLGSLIGLALPIPDGQNTLTRNQCLKENCDPKPSSKVVREVKT